ncbi:NAD(P)/FAD-dependent oxidoreductase [Ancylobacter lacus]|uniref:NAD(P)/FAD-dependent oxidoreductase n=1 Tax=Ancylobacter lacus TaxID=2579970 RepID=UPI001BCD3EDA|nr:FAD-dependent oxidoreductase [Ancylobacter lacus]MBS7538469.1 FAD-binding oxidoreductase [Ancylobacter lacus]
MPASNRSTIRPAAYWWEEAPLPRVEPTPLPARVDVAIIGGGYAGLGAALTLARAGRSVAVFERQLIGEGASTRNGGMTSASLRPSLAQLRRSFGHARAVAMLKEGKDAREELYRFLAEERIDCDFQLSGLFDGAVNPGDYDDLAREADERRALLGIDTFAVPRGEQHAYIGTEFYHGGSVRRDIGGLHPGKFLAGLLQRTRDAGAGVHEKTTVEGVRHEVDGFELSTSAGQLRSRDLLVCTNGYTDGANPWLRRRLVPVRSRIIATAPLTLGQMASAMPARMMYVDTRKLSYYYRPSPDGTRILFGGRDGTTAGDPQAPTDHLRAEFARIFPGLANVALTHSWFGHVAMNRHMIPRLFVHDGIHYATGFCGSGVVWARWLARKAALRLLGDTSEPPSAFEFAPPPAIPLYRGKPWFIPLVYALYEAQDRKAMRRGMSF